MAGRDKDDQDIDSRLAAAERERADALSGPIQQRLAAARRQAVAEMDQTSARSGFRWAYALPAGAVAAVTLVVALQFIPSAHDAQDTAPMTTLLPDLDESQQVAASELELLEELEFLAWMAEVEEVDAG